MVIHHCYSVFCEALGKKRKILSWIARWITPSYKISYLSTTASTQELEYWNFSIEKKTQKARRNIQISVFVDGVSVLVFCECMRERPPSPCPQRNWILKTFTTNHESDLITVRTVNWLERKPLAWFFNIYKEWLKYTQTGILRSQKRIAKQLLATTMSRTNYFRRICFTKLIDINLLWNLDGLRNGLLFIIKISERVS